MVNTIFLFVISFFPRQYKEITVSNVFLTVNVASDFKKKKNVFSPFQLVNITDNYMTLMSDNGDIREDLRVPDSDVGREIESKFEAGDDFLVSVVGSRTFSLHKCIIFKDT